VALYPVVEVPAIADCPELVPDEPEVPEVELVALYFN